VNSLRKAPELAAYQDEPKQLPSGAFGKNAFLRLGFERQGERSILRELDRRAPLIVQQALYWDEELPGLPCVYIISNAGGVLQGDRYAVEFEVGANAQAHVTTQSATKIQSMDANYAAQTQKIVLHENAYLEFLPDPMIPHQHTRFITRTDVTIDPSATLLYSEILMAGRKYYEHGELYEYDVFSSTVHAQRPDGTPLFTEKFIVEPRRDSVRRVGIMGQFDVFANVILLTPKQHADRIFEQITPVIDLKEQIASGVSRLPNEAGLLFKVVGMETAHVRAQVRNFWSLVRPEVTGAPIMREFLWR
jgi:urease accessory protein